MLDSGLDVARKVLDVNVVAAFSWIKKAVAAGLGDEAHPGAVVNLASVAGQGASGVIGWYGVSKAALIHLTTELGYELGPDVRVNAVAPAVVKTKFAEALYEGREEKVVRAYPMKRLGLPGGRRGRRQLPAEQRRVVDHRPDADHRRRRHPGRLALSEGVSGSECQSLPLGPAVRSGLRTRGRATRTSLGRAHGAASTKDRLGGIEFSPGHGRGDCSSRPTRRRCPRGARSSRACPRTHGASPVVDGADRPTDFLDVNGPAGIECHWLARGAASTRPARPSSGCVTGGSSTQARPAPAASPRRPRPTRTSGRCRSTPRPVTQLGSERETGWRPGGDAMPGCGRLRHGAGHAGGCSSAKAACPVHQVAFMGYWKQGRAS